VSVAQPNRDHLIRDIRSVAGGLGQSSPKRAPSGVVALDEAPAILQSGPSTQCPAPPHAYDGRQIHWVDSACVAGNLPMAHELTSTPSVNTSLDEFRFDTIPSLLRSSDSLLSTPDPQPQIISITPNSGPLNGGTEVIILGTNFWPSHKCVFGDTIAKTMWWNDGTLRCIVPSSTIPGPVLVTIEGHPLTVGGGKDGGGVSSSQLPWFTYEDTGESDL